MITIYLTVLHYLKLRMIENGLKEGFSLTDIYFKNMFSKSLSYIWNFVRNYSVELQRFSPGLCISQGSPEKQNQ